MENDSHIANCKECSEAMSFLDTAACAINDVSSIPATDHLTPEITAAYVERNLSKRERQEVECHVADCDECRCAIIDLAEVVAPVREPRPFFSKVVFSHASFAVAGAAICLLLMIGPFRPTAPQPVHVNNPSNQTKTMGIPGIGNGSPNSPGTGSIESDMAFIEVLSPSTVDDLRAVEGTWEAFIHADSDMAAKTLQIVIPKWEQNLKDDPEYHDVKKIIKRLQTKVMEEQSEAPTSGGGR